MPTGLVKSTIQASDGGEFARPLRDLEHDRHGPHGFGEATGAGRLLADAAARRRDRLVAQPRRLAADPDLDQDGVGAVERAVDLARELERSRETLALKDPLREPAHDVEPRRVDVVEHEVAHAQAVPLAREAGNELGRVGRPRADHRQLHPATPMPYRIDTDGREMIALANCVALVSASRQPAPPDSACTRPALNASPAPVVSATSTAGAATAISVPSGPPQSIRSVHA